MSRKILVSCSLIFLLSLRVVFATDEGETIDKLNKVIEDFERISKKINIFYLNKRRLPNFKEVNLMKDPFCDFPYFYGWGDKGYFLESYGPDMNGDSNLMEFRKYAKSVWGSEAANSQYSTVYLKSGDIEENASSLVRKQYDPTNGLLSDGDIILMGEIVTPVGEYEKIEETYIKELLSKHIKITFLLPEQLKKVCGKVPTKPPREEVEIYFAGQSVVTEERVVTDLERIGNIAMEKVTSKAVSEMIKKGTAEMFGKVTGKIAGLAIGFIMSLPTVGGSQEISIYSVSERKRATTGIPIGITIMVSSGDGVGPTYIRVYKKHPFQKQELLKTIEINTVEITRLGRVKYKIDRISLIFRRTGDYVVEADFAGMSRNEISFKITD